MFSRYSGNWLATCGLGPSTWGTYNLYRGVGDSLGDVNFAAPVAGGLVGETASITGLGHAPSTKYTYVLRPVRGGLEMPNVTARCVMETGADGEWVGTRPAPVQTVSAKPLSGGRVKVSWSYRTPVGAVPAVRFALYHGSSRSLVPGAPRATAAFEGDGPYSYIFSFDDGQVCWFAVTAVSGEGLESVPGQPVGPFIADASGPNPPSLAIETTF